MYIFEKYSISYQMWHHELLYLFDRNICAGDTEQISDSCLRRERHFLRDSFSKIQRTRRSISVSKNQLRIIITISSRITISVSTLYLQYKRYRNKFV